MFAQKIKLAASLLILGIQNAGHGMMATELMTRKKILDGRWKTDAKRLDLEELYDCFYLIFNRKNC